MIDPRYRLELAPDEPVGLDGDGWLRVSLRLSVFDDQGLRERWEQGDIELAAPAHTRDADRLAAYVRAWRAALPALIEELHGGVAEPIMPSELVFAALLADAAL